MQTINISEFRANLLKYLEIANSGEQISVTSNGKLLATIMPPTNKKSWQGSSFKHSPQRQKFTMLQTL